MITYLVQSGDETTSLYLGPDRDAAMVALHRNAGSRLFADDVLLQTRLGAYSEGDVSREWEWRRKRGVIEPRGERTNWAMTDGRNSIACSSCGKMCRSATCWRCRRAKTVAA